MVDHAVVGVYLLLRLYSWYVKKSSYPEELLSSRNDVSNDDRCAEWINDVLVVGVQDQTVGYFAYIERRRIKFRFDLFEE